MLRISLQADTHVDSLEPSGLISVIGTAGQTTERNGQAGKRHQHLSDVTHSMHEHPDRAFKKSGGFSLVELIVVVGIIAVLVAIAGLQYSRLVTRYNVEREIREMQVDLLNGRTRAMGRNRMHFFTWDSNSYVLYEDTNPRPDGNGTLETASDAKIVQKNLRYAVTWTSPNKTIRLTAGGLVPPTDLSNNEAIPDASIRVASSTGADYDCIIIGETRTNIGRWNGTDCDAK